MSKAGSALRPETQAWSVFGLLSYNAHSKQCGSCLPAVSLNLHADGLRNLQTDRLRDIIVT